MPYDVQLAQINTTLGGIQNGSGYNGFPGNSTPPFTNFRYLLYSQWVCSPLGGGGIHASIGPSFVPFLGFGSTGVNLTGVGVAGGSSNSTIYSGSFAPALINGIRSHMILSVDTVTETIQVYINDQPVTLSGAWEAGGPWYFNLNYGFGRWDWDVSGALTSGAYPGIGDVWCASPPGFVDLSVTANRRKFINADLSPVDLGATGTAPFGYQPSIYLSVRPGGVATDILINRGGGNPTLTYDGSAPTFQATGLCTLPVLPPPPPSLTMDNVLAIDQTPLNVAGSQVFLMWSDDRGHSFGSPVGQPIGQAGEYLTVAQWQRLGYGRDRVWKLEWSVPVATALLSAFIEVDTSAKS